MKNHFNGRTCAEFVGLHPAVFFSPDVFFSSGESPENHPGLEKIFDEHPIFESLCRLFHARQLAHDCEQPIWDFAIEIDDLQKTGISSEQIRWLVAKKLIGHATEEPPGGQQGRRFNAFGGFRLTPSSCFTLTDEGASVFKGILPDKQPTLLSAHNYQKTRSDSGRIRTDLPGASKEALDLQPVWDSMRRELRIGNAIVKKFKCRAANQEAILNAFEEDQWPARIDDPLPQVTDLDPKRRLADTIKCLNRKQEKAILKFGGDGTGEGVFWRLTESPER